MADLFSTALNAITSLVAGNQQKQGLKGAYNELAALADDPLFQSLDLAELDRLIGNQAETNILRSREFEQKYDPATAALRSLYPQRVLEMFGDNSLTGLTNEALAAFGDTVGQDIGNDIQVDPTFLAALAAAQQELDLGGSLPQEIQNLVSRNAAERAGAAGTLGSGLGRDVAARDLGLTAMNLKNQRIANAANMGAQATNLNQVVNAFNANLANTNRANRASTLSFLEGLGSSRRNEAANLALSEQPMAGLDPASFANLYVSDINALRDLRQQQAAGKANLRAGKGLVDASTISDIGASVGDYLGGKDIFGTIRGLFG